MDRATVPYGALSTFPIQLFQSNFSNGVSHRGTPVANGTTTGSNSASATVAGIVAVRESREDAFYSE